MWPVSSPKCTPKNHINTPHPPVLMRNVMMLKKANKSIIHINAGIVSAIQVFFNLIILVYIKAISWSSHYNCIVILLVISLHGALTSSRTLCGGPHWGLNILVTAYSGPRTKWGQSLNPLPWPLPRSRTFLHFLLFVELNNNSWLWHS